MQNRLKVGDTIQCHDFFDMLRYIQKLADDGIIVKMLGNNKLIVIHEIPKKGEAE